MILGGSYNKFSGEIMKVTKVIFGIGAAALLALSFAGCASTNKAETAPVAADTSSAKKQKHVEREIIDYKGAALGSEIPSWVENAINGDYNVLSTRPEFKDRTIFTAEGSGKNLDLVKSWVNNFNVQSEFSKSISNYVLINFGGVLQGSKDKEKSETYLKEIAASFSNMKISGLTKNLDYWVQLRKIDNDKNKIEDEYRYYVVYSIDTADFQHQIDEALGKIKAEDEKEQELKNEVEGAMVGAMIYALSSEE